MATFEQELDAELAAVQADVAAYIAEMATEIVARLRERTPVDTGHARANWIISVGSRFDGEVRGTSLRQSDAAISRILSYDFEQGDVFISNNVPYIVRLNEGWSDQAPSGFIEVAIAEGVAEVERRNREAA